MKWRIYYEDGSTFDDTDGAPRDSPAWGVVGIAQRGTHYVRLINGWAWSYRTDVGCWIEHEDQVGFVDQMVHHADKVQAVRIGRYMIDDTRWHDTLQRIVSDTE